MVDDPNSESGQATDQDGGEGAEHSSSISQEEKSVSQLEEPRVPLSRLNKVLDQNQYLTKELADMKEKVEQATAPKKYSREEIQLAVDEGKISQTKAEEILDNQLREEIVQEVKQEVEGVSKANLLDAQLREFETAVPDLLDESSATYTRVAQQYGRLTGELGLPNEQSTMIAAIESVVGPIQALKHRPSASPENPAYPEAGGEGAGGGDSQPKDLTWGDLSKDRKEHYENAIRVGAYADQEAVLAELNWKRPE